MTMSPQRTEAEKLKELLIQLSPLIEHFTAQVCPDCTDVCCRQKRAFPDREDRAFITALNEQLPEPDPARPPDGPCQFMSTTGCVRPRWLRPWRCTWYFCNPLLDAMQKGRQKDTRALSALIRQVIEIRSRFSQPFCR
jgi:hypothetical protein